MSSVPIEDINYLAEQSSGKINMILSGMTALMNDTDNKVETMESQGWFKRMVKTVSGKNKLTKDEIRKNHDKLNAYMSQAIAELYNRNCIDEKVMMSLGTQLNELYADHIQLKQMLGAFVSKLNEKIDSVDNFHMLTTEINQGVYSFDTPIVAMCKIISQFDKRILDNSRKLDILRRSMVSQNIINNDKIQLSDYLKYIVEIPVDEIGQIYLELGTIKDNFISNVIIEMIEQYHFLPDMARKFKNKDSLIQEVINNEKLDGTIKVSISDIYDDFINSKLNVNNTLLQISNIQEDSKSSTQVDLRLEKAEQLYLEHKLYEAFKLFKVLAEEGNIYSQRRLGSCYEDGEGVQKNLIEAFKWYMKAAENGDRESQYNIGYCYEYGEGVQKNFKEAFKWYMKAAENGDIQAQNSIGYCYEYGKGVEKNLKEAFKWYMKSAEEGYARSQNNIGYCYEYGKGVEKNLKEAFKWYVEAAENGNIEAQNRLRMRYDK